MKSLEDAFTNFTWSTYKDISDSLLQVDDTNLEQEMLTHPSTYSYYHALMSYAKDRVSEAERGLMRVDASIRNTIGNVSITGHKKTVKDIDATVFSSPEYVEAAKELSDANFKYELFKGLVRALEHKKDMMVQVSVNKREEVKLYNR
jgi:hypothetical protein